MTPDEHKAATLAHCLRIAAVDPEYAVWAAGWYEENEPQLLANLRRKVEQHVKRASSATPAPSSTGSPSTASAKPRAGAS